MVGAIHDHARLDDVLHVPRTDRHAAAVAQRVKLANERTVAVEQGYAWAEQVVATPHAEQFGQFAA